MGAVSVEEEKESLIKSLGKYSQLSKIIQKEGTKKDSYSFIETKGGKFAIQKGKPYVIGLIKYGKGEINILDVDGDGALDFIKGKEKFEEFSIGKKEHRNILNAYVKAADDIMAGKYGKMEKEQSKSLENIVKALFLISGAGIFWMTGNNFSRVELNELPAPPMANYALWALIGILIASTVYIIIKTKTKKG